MLRACAGTLHLADIRTPTSLFSTRSGHEESSFQYHSHGTPQVASPQSRDYCSCSSSHHEATVDVEKSGATSSSVQGTRLAKNASGISLYVRRSTGLTLTLTARTFLLTLLDGPYPNTFTAAILRTDRLILVAGGIGITAVLPFIAHRSNVSLFWSLRQSSQELIDDLATILAGLREKYVIVGQRHDVSNLLELEARQGWDSDGVVVCGPGGLCDEAIEVVSKRARGSKTRWELDVEAFS